MHCQNEIGSLWTNANITAVRKKERAFCIAAKLPQSNHFENLESLLNKDFKKSVWPRTVSKHISFNYVLMAIVKSNKGET